MPPFEFGIVSVRNRSQGRRDQAGQVDEAVGVTPFVVIPADDLHQVSSDFCEPGVEDARRGVGHDVGRNDGILGVGEEALELTVGGSGERGVDRINRCRFATVTVRSVADPVGTGTRNAYRRGDPRVAEAPR